ncbi:hypothetical protein R1sor_025310 [Riccia sorocarpa]|uniref:Bifunctional inhibitor/plant lipid transfer protein/seed storage helical domain-containing protein n=1 Tax=Riccia sorocarpa TaxID=122646 RepID=A0ABD3G891_9MARC
MMASVPYHVPAFLAVVLLMASVSVVPIGARGTFTLVDNCNVSFSSESVVADDNGASACILHPDDCQKSEETLEGARKLCFYSDGGMNTNDQCCKEIRAMKGGCVCRLVEYFVAHEASSADWIVLFPRFCNYKLPATDCMCGVDNEYLHPSLLYHASTDWDLVSS